MSYKSIYISKWRKAIVGTGNGLIMYAYENRGIKATPEVVAHLERGMKIEAALKALAEEDVNRNHDIDSKPVPPLAMRRFTAAIWQRPRK